MGTLRRHCPWDAQQTHRSLVQYLLEETLEVVEAIEAGSVTDLREELGDLLLQVYFHAQIASEDPSGFDLEDVARGIADKLVDRHPHVFGPSTGSGSPSTGSGSGASAGLGIPSAGSGGGDPAVLDALNVTWETRKAAQKGRTSVLEGIPEQLSALARATKIITRARARGVDLALPNEPVVADELGADVLQLVARAQANGIDAEQAVRDAVRGLERSVLAAESDARAAQAEEATDRPR
ncbi:MAG TPA: MazG family protein [Propionibacteriaceae bacterium]